MSDLHRIQRSDLNVLVVPRWGQVVASDGVVPWLVVDPHGVPVEPIRRFLADFVARDNSGGSVGSYAYGVLLLRWWRWLHAVEVA